MGSYLRINEVLLTLRAKLAPVSLRPSGDENEFLVHGQVEESLSPLMCLDSE